MLHNFTVYGIVSRDSYMHTGGQFATQAEAIAHAKRVWDVAPSVLHTVKSIRVRDWSTTDRRDVYELPVVE